MDAVKKKAVHMGWGVMKQMKNGRLRITVPCSKRWRGSITITLFLGLQFLNFTGALYFIWSLSQPSEIATAFPWLALAVTGIWLVITAAFLLAVLWHLLGIYVIELSDKTVKVGRSLFGYDFLSTHDATSLLRLRFVPTLNIRDRRYGRETGKIYKTGRYELRLDYGLKLHHALNIAIEEVQVRIIKQVLGSYLPDVSYSNLEVKKTADYTDLDKDILEIKKWINS